MSTRTELALLALILAAAALLRFLWLDVIPVGWHHDEALMGIMASEVYQGSQRPIFFPAYLGQEPLYIYLSAGMMWLMGGNQDLLPLRTTSALVGVATVAVTYFLGRQLFGRRVGLVGAAILALSFSQVMLSRDGYRMITQPPLEGLAVLLAWRAVRQRSLWSYGVAGLALGATIYTYLGARLFPGVLALFAIWWVLTHGWPAARVRLGVTVLGGVAAMVTAPLLLYFATHPGTFSARISQVSVLRLGATPEILLPLLAGNIAKLLASFTVYGDPLWRYNIEGRPIFVGALGSLFYLGLIVALKGAAQRRAAGAMVMAWFVVMLFPSFLSIDAGAYTFRAMGLAPMLFLLPALGFTALWDWTTRRVPSSWQLRTHWAFSILIAIMLSVEGGMTYRDYFTVWARSFGAAYESMADVVAAARYLDQQARPGDEDIFISSIYYPHPTVGHLAPRVYPYLRWFNGNSTLVLSPKGARDSHYVFPLSALPQGLDSYLPPESLAQRSFFDNGTISMIAYRLTPAQVQGAVAKILSDTSFTRTSENLGDQIELIAYRRDRRVEQGDRLAVTAIWRILKDAPSQDYVFFSHLLNNQGARWAQYDDSNAFPSSEWRAGDIVVGRYALEVGPSVLPGRYSVALGVYDRATLARLPAKGQSTAGDLLPLGFVKIANHGQERTAPTVPMGGRLGEGIEFLGFDLKQEGPPGPRLITIDLYWKALAATREDYTVFVQLLNSQGRLVAQSDSQPAGGRFPTSYWDPGEEIADRHQLELDKNLPAGTYKIIAGMYLASTGQRLTAEDGANHLTLTEVRIQP